MQIHFIAIGGSAMHNLALSLHDKGYTVSGSDDVVYEPSRSRLKASGLLPAAEGWFPERIHQELDAVILGMHAKPDNPELKTARDMGLPIYSYPEFIYEQAKDKTRVVIGGSHGKTTITSMILHVLRYHGIEVDFMVGAQLAGFDRMVNLTETNDFILLEGDEYLSSPIDPRPKFLHYKPHIALLSGIAWDHINVFPTFNSYVEQFRDFISSIVNGGSLTYSAADPVLSELVEASTNPIRKIPYYLPEYEVSEGNTFLDTPEGPVPIGVFGPHNLLNLAGAKWICQHMGVDEDDFYEAITSFSGAAKRLETIGRNNDSVIFKDFAHSPSKVAATTAAVREQFPEKKLIACLELHTYSSLNREFLNEYKGALDPADEALVFYSPDAVAIKRLDPLMESDIASAFQRNDLQIYTQADSFREFVFEREYKDTVLLLMSSGNYGGLDFEAVGQLL